MLILIYGHKVYFSSRLFRIFKKWTKKMSKIENPKILLAKKNFKYNKSPKQLKDQPIKFNKLKTQFLFIQ